ncbi:phosphatidylinositol 4-phosphate 3-kinase C2 domain-containing subunit beta-like, partial [Cyanistes caeruleus]|uniref:phosphatidylinositol 4-phosphate 3-kinase C2 domain-containing subunit beta-like n=1 Tax=Cyanistes caeruleus TaxID=156563 RepID=UPI000CDA3A89
HSQYSHHSCHSRCCPSPAIPTTPTVSHPLPPFLPFPRIREFRIPIPAGSSTVDLLIYQALCYTHDELHAVDVEDFLLKICGLEEFLQNKHTLGSHEHIQHCRKFDIDIRLQLLRRKAARSELARTASDDQSPSTLNHHIHLQERPLKQTISRQALSLLFDTFHNEVDAFLAAEGEFPLKAERVIQSVMAICNALAAVESQEITAALNQMPPCPSRMQPKIQKDPNVLAKRENRGISSFSSPAPLSGLKFVALFISNPSSSSCSFNSPGQKTGWKPVWLKKKEDFGGCCCSLCVPDGKPGIPLPPNGKFGIPAVINSSLGRREAARGSQIQI